MNIYFTAPIKAGRAQQPEIKALIATLGQYGSVHAPHSTDETLSQYGETGMSDKEIFERELAALSVADIVVAEVTDSGTGVGYLIARAVVANKKVLALYRGDNTLRLTSILKGDPKISIITYRDVADINDALATYFTKELYAQA